MSRFFNRIKKAKDKKVHFTMENGKPCFYVYRAFPHKNKYGKDEFTEKQLDKIAREKFNIEEFNRKQPNKEGMWQLVEDDGVGRAWKIKFFPFQDKDETTKHHYSLETILELIGRG